MENAAEALKMAFGVLVFVLALSISVNAFSEARQISQTIINYRDREYDTTYVDENTYTDASGNLITQRVVSAETIIPTIYRAYKEHYKIVFDFGTTYTDGLFKQLNQDTDMYEPVNYIDEKDQTLGGDKQQSEFITEILYAHNFTDTDKYKYKGIILNSDGIYDIIKEKQFKESIGIYYETERIEAGEVPDTNPDADTDVSVPLTNRTTKRVITYELIP